jgi:transcription initiation factor TFIIB
MMNTESSNQNQSTCPACGGDSVNDSFESVDGICATCGFVIGGSASAEVLERLRREVSDETQQVPENRTWTQVSKVRNGTEQQVAKALEQLEQVAEELELTPQIKVRAAEIYGEAAKQGLTDGRKTQLVVGAVLSLATREGGKPISLSKLAQVIGVESRSVGRIQKKLRTELRLQRCECPSETYVDQICLSLGSTQRVAERAVETVREARDANLTSGRNPAGVASAAIYAVCDGEHTQREVAAEAGVSRETVRVRMAEFRRVGMLE